MMNKVMFDMHVFSRMISRDIYDVLESVTLKYDDGRLEHPDFFKVNIFLFPCSFKKCLFPIEI